MFLCIYIGNRKYHIVRIISCTNSIENNILRPAIKHESVIEEILARFLNSLQNSLLLHSLSHHWIILGINVTLHIFLRFLKEVLTDRADLQARIFHACTIFLIFVGYHIYVINNLIFIRECSGNFDVFTVIQIFICDILTQHKNPSKVKMRTPIHNYTDNMFIFPLKMHEYIR